MSKGEKISGIALFLWLVTFLLGDMPIHTPVSGGQAYQDSWLGFLLGWAGGFILMVIYVSIIRLNPSKTLFIILKETFGKYIGSILILLYIWYFIYNGSLVSRQFGEYIVAVNYNETPLLFVLALLLLMAAYMVKSGLEVISRVYGMLAILYLISVLAITAILIPQFDFNNFFPVLERGIKPVLKAGLATIGFPFGELVLLLAFYSVANESVNMKKTAYFAVAVGGLLVFINVLRDIMVLGSGLLANQTFPSNAVTQVIPPPIDISPLVVGSLLIGSGIEATTYLYACTLGITQLFNLYDYKPFVFPMAVLMVLLSLWNFTNIHQFFGWLDAIYPYYALPFQTIMPFILLIIALLKKKSGMVAK